MKNLAIESSEAKNKVFGFLSRIWAHLCAFYYDERMKFIVGFTSSRFAFAEFYVNGQKHPLKAENFDQLQRLANHQCERLHLAKVSSFMLAQMWASRRLIKFQSKIAKLEIVTYWHF